MNHAIDSLVQSTPLRRIDMIYSHRHLDHIGGAPQLYKHLKDTYKLKPLVWGTQETKKFLEDPGLIDKMPQVTILVWTKNGRRTLDITSTFKVQMTIISGHAQQDLFILMKTPSKNILQVVDYIRPGSVPFYNFALTIELKDYIDIQHEMIDDVEYDVIIPGHGRLGTKQDARINLQYVMDVIQFAADGLSEITGEQLGSAGYFDVGDETKPQFLNGEFLLSTGIEIGLQNCLRKVIRKYGCVLASTTEYSVSHCFTATFFNILDVF